MFRTVVIFAFVVGLLGFKTVYAAGETREIYGIGRLATTAEINAWNIDVMPDGSGLPAGSGTVSKGATIYSQKCASCHGANGSEGPYETLVGPVSLADQIKAGKKPKRTIANLWPSAPILFDYIRRTMPFNEPGSLTQEEVYSLTGWLLYKNGLLKENQIVDASVLSGVKMPASSIFIGDPRRPWLIR